MDLYDFIIIGTGSSAVSAALELTDHRVLFLDVGTPPPDNTRLKGNVFSLRRDDPNQSDYFLGRDFEGLANVVSDNPVSLKLKAPLTSFVLKDAERHCPISSETFSPFVSFALGGLANAWGAGVFRFNDYDLEHFPIAAAELAPFYEGLTNHMGINGKNDDLERYFGKIDGLQPPLHLNANGRHLSDSYTRNPEKFQKRGITIGRDQLAILTEDKDGRAALGESNGSFFTCDISSIYTPNITLNKLRERENVTVMQGHLVTRFSEESNRVTVSAQNLESGENVTFSGSKLLIGAGAINTGKLVLQSNDDFTTALPILDNPVSFIPFVDLRAIGDAVDTTAFDGGQLIAMYDGPLHAERILASFYSYITPLHSDIFFDFPLSFRGNLALSKHFVPAMSILQLFYPCAPSAENTIRLQPDGVLNIDFEKMPERGPVERHFMKAFLGAGFVSHPSLVVYPDAGNSIHYAGTVPMERTDLKYHTDKEGRLSGADHVHLIDGAVFPYLPAKNLTFTIMANAMRIARAARKGL